MLARFNNVAVCTADLMTPHLPQAASSPQAPQGEDSGVQAKLCANIEQFSGMRNAMVYSGVSNRVLAITVSVAASKRH